MNICFRIQIQPPLLPGEKMVKGLITWSAVVVHLVEQLTSYTKYVQPLLVLVKNDKKLNTLPVVVTILVEQLFNEPKF
jgi:hypothetical protein